MYENVFNLTEEENKKMTGMMKHWKSVKEQYDDCIIFYRLGDFYEMFFQDAIKASKILELTLTGRDCGLDERAPMCGIPYHAVNDYLLALVKSGEKVAICEQTEDPSTVAAGQLVSRDIVRVVSIGTITEDSQIEENKNNYILCAYKVSNVCAYAWCDITTGQFYTKKCTSNDKISELCDNLVRISPSEIICNGELYKECVDLPIIKHGVVPTFKAVDETYFKTANAENVLKNHFNVTSLALYKINNVNELICACGALMQHLIDTQKHALLNINNITVETNADTMTLDGNAIRNLELTKTLTEGKRYGSLLWVLDKCNTSMGARLLNTWLLSPLQSEDKINYRLDGVQELYESAILRNGLIEHLKSIRDTERICGKISNNNITPQACRNLGLSLAIYPNVKMLLSGVTSKILNDISNYIFDFSEISKILITAIDEEATTQTKDGKIIRNGFDETLDKYRNVRENAQTLLLDMAERERQQTGIKNLKIDYNRVFGYYIEVTNSFKHLVPYNYVRKQTLAGSERFITDELKKLEEEILMSEECAKKREAELFANIKKLLSTNIDKILKSTRAIACLDVLVSLATVARKNNYCRPEISSDSTLNIVGGRHPVVENASKEQFIPNDTLLDTEENRIMIITGPNMAGKSTYMRQNALIALMAHIGSFVPAKSAQIPIIDRIFTRVGASDNLILDQSTFMVEMTEVANILLNATQKSLLILDEVGRGTSTFDGLSIAWAVVEYLANKLKAKTLFATHYHELSELEGVIDGIKNYKITVKESAGTIIFLRKIMRGSANKSFGIEVASIAGVPQYITSRAKQILKNLEMNDVTKTTIKDKQNYEIEEDNEEYVKERSEVEEIILATDLNTLTPLDALKLLSDLKGKVQ